MIALLVKVMPGSFDLTEQYDNKVDLLTRTPAHPADYTKQNPLNECDVEANTTINVPIST